MFKKGLVTLVCLTVMSALWSWATTTYSISTKINSLGTKAVTVGGVVSYQPVIGGTIKVRDNAAQNLGIKYTNFTTSAPVAVVVTPEPGYKLSALTRNGQAVTLGINQTAAFPVEFVKPAPLATQTLVATFAVAGDTDVFAKTWQLQLMNQNRGGSIAALRGTDTITVTLAGKAFIKNYLDTTPVSVTVTADAGYRIDYLMVNGIKTAYATTSEVVAVDPAVGSRVKSVVAAYRKLPIAVTTNATPLVANGISPVNPFADVYGNVRLIVTPSGTNNIVQSISVTKELDGSAVAYTVTDRFGDAVTLPFRGSVKVTIIGVTSAITVTPVYKQDNTAEMQNCTSTCHLQSSNPAVLAVPATWAASAHYDNAVDCLTCHKTMPGPTPTAATVCVTCHQGTVASWSAGAHGAATGHTTGTCQRCHASEGAIVGATVGWTGSYTNVLKAYSSSIWRDNKPAASSNGISCAVCHDHNGLRAINSYNGAVIAFDPNQNGSNDDQFDVCTSCHTMLDNAGAPSDMYHEKSSINVTRMIADSHYDNPATPAATVGTTLGLVEGYVVRKNSANPCADCHNLHSADLTVQEAWAKSAHAGKIASNKESAAKAQSIVWYNALYPATPATAATDSRTIGTSTRTVFEFFQRDAAGVAFYKTVGATDDAAGNAWTHYDWDKTSKLSAGVPVDDRGPCQRCHTATGIANFLTSPATYNAANNSFSHLSGWTTLTGSPQNELLYCWGCHSDSQNGTLRNPGGITEIYAAATAGNAAGTATVAYPNLGNSNVCMACHVGREIGQNVVNDNDADGVRGFINSHYLAAGATIFNESGYEYAGQSYANLGYHKNVGMNDAYGTGSDGPCVTCHMTSAEGHSFEVAGSTTCVNCHSGLTAAALEASEHEFHLALDELNKTLIAKGIEFKPAHPYFYQAGTAVAFTNWAGVYGLASWKDVMGAAFNYNLLEHDPGAYAHNRQYALKLIQDSIDFLADGAIDGNGISAEFSAAASNKEFAELTSHPAAVVAAGVSAVNSCAACHQAAPHVAGNTATEAQFAAQQIGCTDCHAAGDTTVNAAILVQYAESAHGDVKGAAWVSSEMFNSSCVRCHSTTGFIAGGAPAIPFTTLAAGGTQQVLACSGCHTSVETGAIRAKGAIAATFKSRTYNNISSSWNAAALATFPNTGEGNNLCISCHSGRESGESVLALADAGMNNVSFKNPHYLGAAGMMYAKLAFIDFADRTTPTGSTKTVNYGLSLTSSEDGGKLTSTHRILGTPAMATDSHLGGQVLLTGGPCVTCHMSNVKDHTWEVNANAFNEICVKCHTEEAGTPLTAANFKELFIEEQAVPYTDAIAVAEKALLDNFHIAYTENHPYWFDNDLAVPAAVKDWTRGGALSAADAKKLMGACLNIKLMKADPAAYAHARSYVRRVLYDTIDWLDDKTINMSAGNTAIAAFPAKYVKDATAAGTTTESFKFLAGYDRTLLTWSAYERP